MPVTRDLFEPSSNPTRSSLASKIRLILGQAPRPGAPVDRACRRRIEAGVEPARTSRKGRYAMSRDTTAAKTWRRLKGENQLPKVVRGVKFQNGIEGHRNAGSPRRLIEPRHPISRIAQGPGQAAQALRVRRRHHPQALQGRPVRHPCQGAAGQSLRRPHPRKDHPGDRTADRQSNRAPARRCRLPPPPDYTFRIYTSKRKRRLTPQIKREMRRRAPVEPVIGHLKNEHRMDRNTSTTAPATPTTRPSPKSVTTSVGSAQRRPRTISTSPRKEHCTGKDARCGSHAQ
jgi:hypothetical protein